MAVWAIAPNPPIQFIAFVPTMAILASLPERKISLIDQPSAIAILRLSFKCGSTSRY
jgi:hypothetical protein